MTNPTHAVRTAFESPGGRDYDDRTTRALDDLIAATREQTLLEVLHLLGDLSVREEGSSAAVLLLARVAREVRGLLVK